MLAIKTGPVIEATTKYGKQAAESKSTSALALLL